MGQITSPSNVQLSTSSGIAYLSWENGDSYTSVIIYRNTTNSPQKLTSLSGAPTSFQDQPGSGTFYYWVQGQIVTKPWTDPETGIRYPAQTLTSDIVASSPAYVIISAPSVPSAPTIGTLSKSATPLSITIPISGGGSSTQGYKVERSTDGSNYSEIGIIAYTGGTVNYIDYNILPSTLYYYRARAYNDYGNSSYSNVASTTSSSVTVPGTPSISLAAGNACIKVSITPGSDGTYPRGGFKLAWSTSSPPTTYSSIGDVTSYIITGLSNDTPYYVACKQVDIYGNESSASSVQSATPTAGENSPSAPALIKAELVGKDSVRFLWAPAVPPSGSVIDRYLLQLGYWDGSQWVWQYNSQYIRVVSFSTDITLDGLYTTDMTSNTRLASWYKGKKYWIVIYAKASNNKWSGYAPNQYIWIGPPAMGTVSTDQLANNVVRMKWAPLGGTNFYLIERAEARQTSPGTWGNFSDWAQVATVPANYANDSSQLESYCDTNLQLGTKYKWRISPYDRYGNTNTSSTTSEVVIGGQAILDPDWCEAQPDWDASGNSIIYVSWGAGYVAPPRRLVKYQITRNTSPSLPGSYIVDVDGSVTQFTDTGSSGLGSISNNTTYYYGVRTKDDLGNVSAWEISNAVIPRGPSPPPPPTNLVVYAQGNSIVATWTPAPEALASVLYRSTDGSSFSIQHAGASTTLYTAASAGATSIRVASYSGLARGDYIYFDDAEKQEAVCITTTVSGTTIYVTPLHYAHSSGVSVKKIFSPSNPKYTETVTMGTKLYFKALSINGHLLSGYSNTDYAVAGEPSRPTVSASVSGNDIVITWTKSVPGIEANTISHYHFYWRVSGGSWSSANQVSGTSVNLSSYTTVQVNVTYEFKVEAEDSAGLVSEASIPVTCGRFGPNPPGNLIAFAQQESGVWYIFVQWSPPDQTTYPISSYDVYRKPEGGSYTKITNTSSITYKDPFSGLSAGTRYYYYAVAKDIQGLLSNNSNIDSALVGEPEKPTNVRVVMGDGQATVYWSASTPGSAPLDHYHVWMSTDGSNYSKVGDNLNADPNAGAVVTSFTKTGLTNGLNYWFKVSVIDKAGIESEYSEVAQVRPYLIPNPPRNVVATAGHLKIHLDWDKPLD